MRAAQPLPCRHPAPQPKCPWCRLAASDPRYAALFGSRAASPALPCSHLGAPTGWTVDCPTCPGKGKVSLKLFHCTKHEKCTIGKKVEGVACCVGCPDHSGRQPRPAAPEPLPEAHQFSTRDCLYHVYPLPGEAGQVWRQRLGMLLRRASLFNGKRVISCMTGARLEPPSAVRALAQPAGFDVVELENHPGLREARTLIELLPRFESDDPHRVLFFGHAKGVTRQAELGNACHPWAILCHEITLDYWPLVEHRLGRHPIVGPFKKVGPAFQGSRSAWHYSGSFFWARSADLFGRDWRGVDRKWFGVESTPGVWYAPEEAGCLFHEAGMHQMDLYKPEYMREVLAEYSWWRAEHDGMRTAAEATPEIARLRGLVASLADRVAGQSELLSQRAERAGMRAEP
jgi:hypothetical protein